MNEQPFAMFFTWTTYGTWLPGDERGHVSNRLRPDGRFEPKQNRPGTPYAAGDPFTRQRARELQSWPTVWLTEPQAAVVAKSLAELSQLRGWMILRAAVMSNHVHVVLAKCPTDGPAVRRILKGVTQSDLSKSVGQSRRWWTSGGSDRLRQGEPSILETVRYTANQPGKLAEIVENRVLCRNGEDVNQEAQP
jgi:REP element-mobilizing transposase RayT